MLPKGDQPRQLLLVFPKYRIGEKLAGTPSCGRSRSWKNHVEYLVPAGVSVQRRVSTSDRIQSSFLCNRGLLWLPVYVR